MGEWIKSYFIKDGEFWECLYFVEQKNGRRITRKIYGTEKKAENQEEARKLWEKR